MADPPPPGPQGMSDIDGQQAMNDLQDSKFRPVKLIESAQMRRKMPSCAHCREGAVPISTHYGNGTFHDEAIDKGMAGDRRPDRSLLPVGPGRRGDGESA